MARSARVCSVTGLGAAAVVHAAWARGSTWPAASRDDLADLVVGRRPMPSSTACAAVAGLLTTAVALVVARAGVVPVPEGRATWVVHRGADAVAAVLTLRGMAGLVVSGAGLGSATPLFRRWDLRLYSPACLVLGGAVALSAPAGRS